jgi:peptide/nickel transport system substrate-binding protein
MKLFTLFITGSLVFLLVLTGCTSLTPPPAVLPGPDQPASDLPAQDQPVEVPETESHSLETVEPDRVEVVRLNGRDEGFPSPFHASRGPAFARMSLIFDTLVWKDASGDNIPWLAEEWSPSLDGLTWRFKIREGVHWNDGQLLTVDDVIFTFDYFSEYRPPLSYAEFDLIDRVIKVDEWTVEFQLNKPSAPFLRNTAGTVPIIPRHIWENVSDPIVFVEDKALVGTGAYRLKEYNKAEGSYLFEANDYFWLGPPYVKRIEMFPVGDELLALKSGVIDGGRLDEITSPVLEELFESFLQDERYGVVSAPGEWNLVLYFNMARGIPFNDLNFRKAVAYALDLDFMVDHLLLGYAMPGLPGNLAPSNPWVNPDVKPFPHDPDKARSILDQAGYIDRNGDGIRETPDGQPMKYELVHANWYSPRFAELIKMWLEDIGIDITLKLVDRVTSDEITSGGKYELALVGFGGRGADPDSLRPQFSSRMDVKRFTRVLGYHNERFDELADQQIEEMDEARRVQMIYEMQEILGKDIPTIPLYYPNRNHIFIKDTLENWYYTPGGFGGGVPNVLNKHIFITGMETGLQIRGR